MTKKPLISGIFFIPIILTCRLVFMILANRNLNLTWLQGQVSGACSQVSSDGTKPTNFHSLQKTPPSTGGMHTGLTDGEIKTDG